MNPRLGRRPPSLPPATHSGIQRRGIMYERKVAQAVSQSLGMDAFLIHGQWIYVNGTFCQPDIIVIQDRGPRLVLEVKLTRKGGVERKLREVYGPLVQTMWGGDVAYAQVYRNMDGRDPDHIGLESLSTLKPLSYCEIMWR